MRSITKTAVATALATLTSAGAAHAFTEIPIQYDANGNDLNSGTMTAAGSPALSGTELANACEQYPMTTREDVFQWLNWLRSCGTISEDDAEGYAPGYKQVEAAWIQAKKDALRDPTKGGDALTQAQANALNIATATWTYPIFIDPSGPRPVTAAMSDASPIFTPYFFDWVTYYKTTKLNGRIKIDSLIDADKVQGCYSATDANNNVVSHSATGGKNIVLAGACTIVPGGSLKLDSAGKSANNKEIRCRSEDVLWDTPSLRTAADQRNHWSYGCNHIPLRLFSRLYGNQDASEPNLKFYVTYAADATQSQDCLTDSGGQTPNPATLPTWTHCFPVWKPESDGNNAPTQKDATGKYSACTLPTQPYKVIPFTQCEFGCYAPEERLLFSDGYQAIKDAVDSGRLDIMTLGPKATFEDIRLIQNRVEKYVADPFPQEQPMVTITTESGATLHITPTHPLLTEDGTIRAAKDFQPGDRLVRIDGTFEAVQSIASGSETVQVFNPNPVTKDDTSNLLVAEGFLTASHRYQDPEILRQQRQMLRHNVPDDHIQ